MTELLSLPVPLLEDTSAQYLEAMEPIADPASFAKTRETARAFALGEGKKLQDALKRHAAELAPASWLKDYSRERFLSIRTPLSIVGNFSMEFSRSAAPCLQGLDRASAAALLAHSVGRLYKEIADGVLPIPPGAAPTLREEQFSQVLGAARHPEEGTDRYEVYAPFREAHSFGLFWRNRYHLVRFFDERGNLSSPGALRNAISRILTRTEPPLDVNFNTAGFAGSGECAPIFRELLADAHNRTCYDAMCRSVFHLALDERPRSARTFNHLLYSDAQNLWLYKPWSLTLFADNAIAANNEHTAIDGVSNVWLYERMFAHLNEASRAWDDGEAAEAESVEFRFSPRQERTLREMKERYLKRIETFRYAEFRRDGVDWASFRERGIGRDALIQLGFAYAQRPLYGRFKSTHESISTAHFHQGRTSCLRSATPEAVEFVRAADGNSVPAEVLLSLLQKVSERHSRNVRRAKQNICFVRHGAGLMEMARRHGAELGIAGTPAIFEDENYKRFCTQELSTSTIGGSGAVEAFAFAPTATGGLGLGYLARDGFFQTTVTWDEALLPGGRNFVEHLNRYCEKLDAIMRARSVYTFPSDSRVASIFVY